jgi:hypothetical protein
MIRLTRTIEYEYESVEEMAKDVAGWTLRPGTSWFPFNARKRARSRIETVVEVQPVPSEAPSAPGLCGCGHPAEHHHEHRNIVNNAYCDHFICSCQGFESAVQR